MTRRWNDKASGEKREETTWFRVAAYGYLADNAAAILKKGSQVMVDGRVSARAYLDNNQQPAVSLGLNAETFQILGSRGSGSDESESEAERSSAFDHDIPF